MGVNVKAASTRTCGRKHKTCTQHCHDATTTRRNHRALSAAALFLVTITPTTTLAKADGVSTRGNWNAAATMKKGRKKTSDASTRTRSLKKAASDAWDGWQGISSGSNVLVYVGQGGPFGRCIGNCNSDDECTSGLVCYQAGTINVPGCGGMAIDDVGYCVDPADVPQSQALTRSPTILPTPMPTGTPTNAPSPEPTTVPSVGPTNVPTLKPTTAPSPGPTNSPSAGPTSEPSPVPTSGPSLKPTNMPSVGPTNMPSPRQTTWPSPGLTNVPSVGPTNAPSQKPTLKPTTNPTVSPSEQPSTQPSFAQSYIPSRMPSSQPTPSGFSVQLSIAVLTSMNKTSINSVLEDAAARTLSQAIEEVLGYTVLGNTRHRDRKALSLDDRELVTVQHEAGETTSTLVKSNIDIGDGVYVEWVTVSIFYSILDFAVVSGSSTRAEDSSDTDSDNTLDNSEDGTRPRSDEPVALTGPTIAFAANYVVLSKVSDGTLLDLLRAREDRIVAVSKVGEEDSTSIEYDGQSIASIVNGEEVGIRQGSSGSGLNTLDWTIVVASLSVLFVAAIGLLALVAYRRGRQRPEINQKETPEGFEELQNDEEDSMFDDALKWGDGHSVVKLVQAYDGENGVEVVAPDGSMEENLSSAGSAVDSFGEGGPASLPYDSPLVDRYPNLFGCSDEESVEL